MLLHEELSEKILGCYFTVYNKLGYGFLEKVYENAMMIELCDAGLTATAQKSIEVYYEDQLVGNYFADIIVEDKVIVELKAAAALLEEHEAQLLNYLRATKMEVGLLLNFGVKPEFRRKVFTNSRK
jgi:GxxExxY protein